MKRLILLLAMFGLTGCGITQPIVRSQNKLSKVSLGEDRQTVMKTLGKPDAVSHAETTADGRQIQIDEYRLHDPTQAALNAILGIPTLTVTWWTASLGDKFFNSYFLGYTNGKLTHIQKEKLSEITIKER